jgi:hypothetical protein
VSQVWATKASVGITWPITSESNSMRVQARCCVTVGRPPGLQQFDVRGHVHRLNAPEFTNPLPFAPAGEIGGGAAISRPRVPVADVDSEEFKEAQRGPLPCPGDERRKRRPRRCIVGWNERANGTHRLYTSLR